MDKRVEYLHFPVGPLGCICTIVADHAIGQAVVIDGGADVPHILRRLEKLEVRATALLHTHAHIDHIGASAELRARTAAPASIHHGDIPLSRTLEQQAELLGIDPVPEAFFDATFGDGDRLSVGSISVSMLHTPGHTPGSTCFSIEGGGRNLLVTGDTLFAGAVGRWDLGGTSLADIVRSIRGKLLMYPDETPVIPGHGAQTSIGRERASNPFLR